MTGAIRKVHTTIGVELIRHLTEQGYRIFTIEEARNAAIKVGLAENYLVEVLHHLVESGWIVRIQKGLYTLSSDRAGVSIAHEFEIAMALTQTAAISHWSALHYYNLTEQIPQRIFVLTTINATVKPTAHLLGIDYQFIKVQPERFFGTQKIWIGDARAVITDPERTLLDGLMKPQYCGDFAEVLHAFELYLPKIKLERIIDYALKLDLVVAKRLGWILEYYGIDFTKLKKLIDLPITGYRPLDPTQPKKGRCNNRWSIQENFREKQK